MELTWEFGKFYDTHFKITRIMNDNTPEHIKISRNVIISETFITYTDAI